jgi:hypothetical protein
MTQPDLIRGALPSAPAEGPAPHDNANSLAQQVVLDDPALGRGHPTE